MSKKNKTLKDILDCILYENPSTQDEIAEKLGITRRYVTQLLQPLVKEGTVKRAYMIDLKVYEKLAEKFECPCFPFLVVIRITPFPPLEP